MISVAIFYYIYIAAVAIFLIFGVLNIYVLLRFSPSWLAVVAACIFVFGALAILSVAWPIIATQVNWQTKLNPFPTGIPTL